MSDKPFSYEVINGRERPLSSDVDMVMSYSQLALRELMKQMYVTRTSLLNDADAIYPALNAGAFFGSGFRVRQFDGTSMSVKLDSGLGLYNDGSLDTAIFGVTGLDDYSIIKPMVLTSAASECTSITGISNGDPSNPRIDIIEVKVNRTLTDYASRDILNTTTGIFAASSVGKTMNYALDDTAAVIGPAGTAATAIVYRMGTPAASPAAPATDTGYVKIAEIKVATSATAITNNKIVDRRRMLFANGSVPFSLQAFVSGAGTLSLVKAAIPPGCSMAAYAQAGGTLSVGIFMGDGPTFQSISEIATIYHQSQVASSDIQIGAIVWTLGTVDATIQSQLAAGSPALSVAIGQPFLFTNLTSTNTGTGTLYALSGTMNIG